MNRHLPAINMILAIFATAFALTFVSMNHEAPVWRIIWIGGAWFSLALYFQLNRDA